MITNPTREQVLMALADGEKVDCKSAAYGWDAPEYKWLDPELFRRSEWRIHEPEPAPKRVPLGPEDVPLNAWFWREASDCYKKQALVALGACDVKLGISLETIKFQVLMDDNYFISRDFGKTWVECSKEAK